MAEVKIAWEIIREVPMTETSWTNIQAYAHVPVAEYPERAVYCIRLSPPYMVHYGDEDDNKDGYAFVSPVIYIGSGNSKNRLGTHTKTWLPKMAAALPNARFEMWIAKPRVRKSPYAYKAFEGYLLHQFQKRSGGFLPLFNKQKAAMNARHSYDEAIFSELIKFDRRHIWAIWPYQGKLHKVYDTGGS